MSNIGLVDRIIRIVIVGLIAAAYWRSLINGTLSLVLGAVALVLLVTSLTATCPAYMPFGISTRGKRR